MRWRGWLLVWVLLAPPGGVALGRLIRTGQVVRPCGRCHHPRPAHEHYRAGTAAAWARCPECVGRQVRAVRWIPLPRRDS